MGAVLPLRFGTPMPAGSGGASPLLALVPRQYVQQDDGDYVWFWYTTPGLIIKYVVFLGFLLLLFGWIIGGRIHAKRRVRKGLKPLAYHAWLLSRQERAQVDPAYAYPQAAATPVYGVYRPAYGQSSGGAGEYYGMHPMPPPVYDPARPPVYDGPPSGSKVDPAQGRAPEGQPAPDYAPPAGPPPGR
ncbi:hypothetical protein F4802DRAFT_16135 [Xylaria palmicola]|nr:hypothetical protein F4802DRAFT_16135 [Xylaria palmicola]